MSVWGQYTPEECRTYEKYLQGYGALTKLFTQKNSHIPYLDSKFQETVYAKAFNSKNTDIGNTPHDILSVINGRRIGIGLKTWMSSAPSYQKVMQLKRFKDDINQYLGNPVDLASKISEIKNGRLELDYSRLGLDEYLNIYHYVVRDAGVFKIAETTYPKVDISHIHGVTFLRSGGKTTAIQWSDGKKHYKYTFADSQVYMKFDLSDSDTVLVDTIPIKVLDDPFAKILELADELAVDEGVAKPTIVNSITDVAYLPLYSFRTGEVEKRSGLNAWNGAPKNKSSNSPRPLGEVYIPVPIEFHKKYPSFFVDDIFRRIKNKQPVEFNIILPNGLCMPGRLTGDNLKNFQSGSNDPNRRKPNGERWGQADLGNWLLVDVLGLHSRELVTREWLSKRGVDSVKLWHENGDKSKVYLDIAPTGSFEKFMRGSL